MFRYLRSVVLVAAMMICNGVAFADQDLNSASFLMSGCRGFLEPDYTQINLAESLEAGTCNGIVQGLLYAALFVCAPKDTTSEQAVRVVVKYIDDRPARLNENFKLLALEALRATWPCTQ
jgi:hypothetical protein